MKLVLINTVRLLGGNKMKYVYVVNSKENSKSVAVFDFTDNSYIELFDEPNETVLDTGWPCTWNENADECEVAYRPIDEILADIKAGFPQLYKSDDFVISNIPWEDCVKRIREVGKTITIDELQHRMLETLQ